MYDERTRQVYAGDYPVLFWLQKLLGKTPVGYLILAAILASVITPIKNI